ncbi:tRNA dimethylallyltransferase-like isoform X2 [Antedon mediterranea]|uniref:tRNA dimethylallyltransferase-like isoform X2 n=1 Tax=Antedon mediterranea TaxID=105859 RepID=UPI003AF44D8D
MARKMLCLRVCPTVVVLGATGAGKSKLALDIAKRVNSEIISADSMQVYRGLNIITNKVNSEEIEACPHHVIDYVNPLSRYTVVDFRDKALPIVDSLLEKGKLPIIVGGTNYYIEALLWKVLLDPVENTGDDLLIDKRGGDIKMIQLRKRSLPDNCMAPKAKHQQIDHASVTGETVGGSDLEEETTSKSVLSHGSTFQHNIDINSTCSFNKMDSKNLFSCGNETSEYDKRDSVCDMTNKAVEYSVNTGVSNTGVTGENTGVTLENTGVNMEKTCVVAVKNTCVTVDNAGPTLENTAVTMEHTGVTMNNTGVTVDNTGVTVDNTGVTVDNTGVTVDNAGVTVDNAGVTVDNTSTKGQYFNIEVEKFSSEQLHSILKDVDPEMADRLHPKNRRKIIRSLHVFEQHNIPHSRLLADQQATEGGSSLGGPLRYSNVCVFWVQSDQTVLDDRLDRRVDGMLEQGLLKELSDFHSEYNQQRLQGGLHKEELYSQGIFQSIGFKEFHDYLILPEKERDKEIGVKLKEQGIEKLKQVTRRYARKQLRWINNRFLKRRPGFNVPPVYGLDATDATQWDHAVLEPAMKILSDVMEGKMPSAKPLVIEERSEVKPETTFVCDICSGRIIVGHQQWQAHLKSRVHFKRAKKIRKKELLAKFAQES